MISALTSKEDSDRLIRDLMKKAKDLEKQLAGVKQAHADGASALKDALADRAAMAEQFGQLKSEKDAMDAKYQSLKGKNGKLKDKVTALKGTIQEFESVLQSERAQYKELEEMLEDQQSQARRRERQLSNDLVLVTQERDGYSEQLVSLRDKISLLSRELAEGEEGGRAKGQRIEDLEAQLKAAKDAAEASDISNAKKIAELEAEVADGTSALEKTKRNLKQELARVSQERDGYKDQVETLRDKVSLLSRDLADNQDSSVSQGSRIASLEAELRKAEEALSAHKAKLEQTEADLQASQDQSYEQEKSLEALKNELQEACDAHARAVKSWQSEKQILTQDRDGFKSQLDSLRDKVSSLSRQLAEHTDSNEKRSSEVSCLQEEIARMKEEHEARVAELQERLDSTSSSLQERSDEQEAAQMESKRQAAAWKVERAQILSDRDGYKGQVETLRDKVSALARDMTASSDSSDARMSQLQSQLQSATGLLDDAHQQVARLEQESQASQATISGLTQERDAMKQQHLDDTATAEAAHSKAVALWEQQRAEICQERDSLQAQLAAAQALVAQLRTDIERTQGDHRTAVAQLQTEIATLKAEAEHQTETSQGLRSQLQKECDAHASTHKELDASLTSSKHERKAWKAEKAMLINERDGSVSQVETLRDKVSSLSRELATSQGDSTEGSPQTSWLQEMQELRNELSAAQSELESQMSMVQQLQAELLTVQANTKNSQPQADELLAAKQALHEVTERSNQLQRELLDTKNELESALTASNPSHGQHQLVGLMNSARDILRTIAQTLGQPEPVSSRLNSVSGTEVSMGDVMSSMNAACTVAEAARRAWDAERCALEDKAVQAAATGAMSATRDADAEKATMRQELLKLQGQIELLEQREIDLAAAQDMAKVQVAALTVELQSSTSEVERASASADSIAVAAAEAQKGHRQSVQDLHDRLKSSEVMIEQLSGQLGQEAEAHVQHLAELERQAATERKQWRIERAQLTNERDGFCGQVDMLRDKIVELSRELADLRRRSKSCSGALPPSPTSLLEAAAPDYVITAGRDVPALSSTAVQDWWGHGDSGSVSAELGVHTAPQEGGQLYTSLTAAFLEGRVD